MTYSLRDRIAGAIYKFTQGELENTHLIDPATLKEDGGTGGWCNDLADALVKELNLSPHFVHNRNNKPIARRWVTIWERL